MFKSVLEYPKEYNPKVHGPFNPAVYYGKPDPFSQVKLSEVGSWFARREMSLGSFGKLVTRAAWRYRMKYVLPKKAGATVLFHFIFVSVVSFYMVSEYKYRRQHTWAKYH